MTESLAEKRKFSSAFRQCISGGIRNVLGESVLRAVSSLLDLDESAKNPGELHSQLSPLFGELGAVTLEKVMVKELFQSLNLAYVERGTFDFARYADQARIRVLNEGGEVV